VLRHPVRGRVRWGWPYKAWQYFKSQGIVTESVSGGTFPLTLSALLLVLLRGLSWYCHCEASPT